MRYLKVLFLFVVISFFAVACGSGGGGSDKAAGSDPALLAGIWDMTTDPFGNSVPPGTASLVITNTTYAFKDADCTENGTYTATSTTITTTTANVVGVDCSAPGEVNTEKYSVNTTTLTITNKDGDKVTFKRL